MNTINSIFSDANNFSEKAMPIVSGIYDRFSPDNSSEEYFNAGDTSIYETFSDSLTGKAKETFWDFEVDYIIPKVCTAEREGFNRGFYIGFHLAMELLKGGELNG